MQLQCMFITITCPHCDEEFEYQLDTDETSEFIVDCENCCRPMTVKARVQNGEVESLQVEPA